MTPRRLAALAWALALSTGCGGGGGDDELTGQDYAGPVTIARTYRVTSPGADPFIQTDEVSRYVPPSATRTVISGNAPSYLTRSFTFDAGAVLLNGTATYQPDDTPLGTTTYAPPQMVIPASTRPGATASSTST